MERKGSFGHVKALVNSIHHGSFPSAVLLDNAFPSTNPSSSATEATTNVHSKPTRADAASPTADTTSDSGHVSPSKMPYRLRIPSLVVTGSLSPYHMSSNPPGAGDSDNSLRRFSFALMRRHSNTVSRSSQSQNLPYYVMSTELLPRFWFADVLYSFCKLIYVQTPSANWALVVLDLSCAAVPSNEIHYLPQ